MVLRHPGSNTPRGLLHGLEKKAHYKNRHADQRNRIEIQTAILNFQPQKTSHKYTQHPLQAVLREPGPPAEALTRSYLPV